jgi:UPF0716 protein FxsA
VRELIDGICLLLAGLLLLIPGFATDAIGLLLFVPALRQRIGMWLWRWFKARPGVRFHTRHGGGPAASGDGIIDGEFEEVDEDAPNLPPPSASSKWGRR